MMKSKLLIFIKYKDLMRKEKKICKKILGRDCYKQAIIKLVVI